MNRIRTIPFRSLATGVLLLIGLVVFAPAAQGADQRLTAEEVFTYGDLGGQTIKLVTCSGSITGHAMDYVDMPGEWIAWRITFSEPVCFVDSLHTSGSLGDVRQFRTEFLPDPPAETTGEDSVFTQPGGGLS